MSDDFQNQSDMSEITSDIFISYIKQSFGVVSLLTELVPRHHHHPPSMYETSQPERASVYVKNVQGKQ